MNSERLVFKQVSTDDVDKLHQVFGNVNLTKYFVTGSDRSINDTKLRLNKITEHWNKFKFGDFLVFEKNSEHLIGFGGLHYKLEGGHVNISYIVLEDYQGHGFGHEISTFLIDHGFNHIELNEIVAEIDPKNKISKLLIEKCGFSYTSKMKYKGYKRDEYLINRNQYLTRGIKL